MTNNLKAQGGGLRTNSVSLLRAVLIASLISFIANLIVPSTLSTAMAAGTSYTITWDGRGDTPSSGGSSTYTSGSAVALIPTTPPRYQGLAFKGWIAGNGTPITNGSYTPSADAGNITFYGVWTYANLQTRTPPVGQSVYSISCRAHEDRAGQMSRVNTTSSVLTAVGVGTTDARAMADPCAEAATYNISNDLVYWITPNTNANPRIKGSSLFELNYHTGVSTYIAELTPGTNVNGSDAQGRIFGWGITTDNRTGKMYVLYSDVSESDSTKFYVAEVNRQTGRLTNVFEVSGMCSGLESGQLTVSCSRTFWNESPAGGFAFNPVDSKFYVAVTASGDGFRFKLYRLNPSTGAAEFVSTSPVDRDWSNDNQLMVGISIDASGTIWSMNQRLASGTVAGFANTGDYLESSANTTFNTQTSFVAPSPGIYPCSVAGYFGVGENSANIVGGLSCEGEATIPAVPLPGGTPNEYRLALPAGARSVGVKSAALQNVNLKFASQSGAVNATFTTATVTTPPTFTPNVPGSYVDASLSGVSGATTVCLDGSATDRIYHFTAGAWVDITTSYSNGQVCGLTNSFSPFGVGARLTANVVNEAAKAAAAAAEVKREAEIKTARADISNKLAKSEKLTVDNFKQADIAGVTADNFAAVQAEILALPAQSRTDIKQVQKIARKYEVVGKVATEQVVTLPITAFVEVGLIPADSKNKVALIAAVKRASATDRDSFVEIQAVIAAEAATIKDRKDRLAAAISRNKPK